MTFDVEQYIDDIDECVSKVFITVPPTVKHRETIVMDHFTELMNSKSSGTFKSPTREEMLSPKSITPEIRSCNACWSLKVLTRVKKCRDAIKDMMTFDKMTGRKGRRTLSRCNINSSNREDFNRLDTPKGNIIPSLSVPDIITCNRITAKKYEEIVMITNSLPNSETGVFYSRRNLKELADSQEIIDKIGRNLSHSSSVNDMDDSLKSSSIEMEKKLENNNDNSLKSFSHLKKEITKELENNKNDLFFDDMSCKFKNEHLSKEVDAVDTSLKRTECLPVKKKISAEPFLSYKEEFFFHDNWEDDFLNEA